MARIEINTKNTTARKGNPVARYIRDIIAELKQVVWPSRRETAYLTLIVLIMSIVAGLFLGGIDYAFTKMMEALFIVGQT